MRSTHPASRRWFSIPVVAAFCLLTLASAGVPIAHASAGSAADARIAPPQNVPYPGTIQLVVDATDTARGIFRVHEIIPVKPGELTLFYPQWIPGEHEPSGEIDKLAGLEITANGKRLMWHRYKYDVYAFRVDVPPAATKLDLKFEFLSPRFHNQGPIQMTNTMMDLTWHKVSLYPAGHYTRDIKIQAAMKLPAGWQFGTALPVESQSGNTTTFQPTTYNTLVDSPVYAGRYFKRLDLNPQSGQGAAPATPPVHMDLVADAPKDLAVTPQQLQHLRNLVTQVDRLFRSHHYHHYDFLFSLSDQMSGNGLEHHQSSEDGERADYFTDYQHNWPGAGNLLAHEYTHSWNGKFMRPADLWTPNFNVPMGDSLLWVYEGQTQYWGFVLAARAGMWTPEQFREAMALISAVYDRNRPGFAWRTIEDTTNDPTIAERRPLPYRNWQMSEEYYSAGQMMWLAVDARIRQLTDGRKSLNNFAQDFFGVDNGSMVTQTYTFNDVTKALNDVVRYDWAKFLHSYIDTLHPPLLSGIEASGWKLVYTDKPNEFEKLIVRRPHIHIAAFGMGLTIDKKGNISDVRWNSPAFQAGIGPGATLAAVNGESYTPKILDDAVEAAKTSKDPIKLLLKQWGQYRTVSVDYHGGLQYPHLVRIDGQPDYLDQIIAPME